MSRDCRWHWCVPTWVGYNGTNMYIPIQPQPRPLLENVADIKILYMIFRFSHWLKMNALLAPSWQRRTAVASLAFGYSQRQWGSDQSQRQIRVCFVPTSHCNTWHVLFPRQSCSCNLKGSGNLFPRELYNYIPRIVVFDHLCAVLSLHSLSCGALVCECFCFSGKNVETV